MEQKLKIAIIGVGNIAQAHIAAYQKCENAELYAFCDILECRLKEMGERYGVSRLFTDCEAMLAALPEIDAVSVCTWNAVHAPLTIAALNAGKHVLCEKPMAISATEARAMEAAAQKSGKLLMVGFVRRYDHDAYLLDDFIRQGIFGELYYAKASYLRRNGSPGGWFGDRSRSGGGPLIDLGVHIIDFTRYLLGNPRPVSVYGASFHKLLDRRELKDRKGYVASSAEGDSVFNVEDFASAMIRYETGAVVSIETSFSLNIQEDEEKLFLFGSKAGASLNPELKLFTELNGYMANTSLCVPTLYPEQVPFDNEILHFLDCILKGTPCRSPSADGIILMDILDAVYESAKTGHEVCLL